MVKNNKGGRFNKDLTFTWEKESKEKKAKPMTQEEMSRISAFYNKLFKQQQDAASRN